MLYTEEDIKIAHAIGIPFETYLECEKFMRILEEKYFNKGVPVPDTFCPNDPIAFKKYFDLKNAELKKKLEKEKIGDCRPIVEAGQKFHGLWESISKTENTEPFSAFALSLYDFDQKQNFQFKSQCIDAILKYCWWNGATEKESKDFLDWSLSLKYGFDLKDTTLNMKEKTYLFLLIKSKH